MNSLAVIGGSGVDISLNFQLLEKFSVDTRFGAPSGEIKQLQSENFKFLFLARHGDQQKVPPHLINYRANLEALSSAGVSIIVSINAVGAISDTVSVGQLVIPDQIIDYTWGREHTIDVGGDQGLMHIDFTKPFDCEVRNELIQVAENLKLNVLKSSTIGVTQGPRLESAAEISRLSRDGCDVVGMTSMPEAGIARELNLRYASICIVSNLAAGRVGAEMSTHKIHYVLEQQISTLCLLLAGYFRVINAQYLVSRGC